MAARFASAERMIPCVTARGYAASAKDHPQMKGNYTDAQGGCRHVEAKDHPQMKGNYTAGLVEAAPVLAKDHPQMKGNYT